MQNIYDNHFSTLDTFDIANPSNWRIDVTYTAPSTCWSSAWLEDFSLWAQHVSSWTYYYLFLDGSLESLQLSGYQIALDHYLGGHGIKSCHRLNNLFFVGHAFSMLNYLKLQLYFLIKLTRLPRPDPNFTLATVSLESSVWNKISQNNQL